MSSLKRLIVEVHRRSFWQVLADARRVPLLACTCCLALAALACGRPDERRAAEGSTVTVLYPVDEWGLGPYWSQPSQFLVFLPLVERNAAGELENVLARGWEHSPDYRSWTIHLRTDVRWHDGVPVTAHDIKFTLDLLAEADTWGVVPGSYTVTVLDDSTYTIRYEKQAIGSPLDDYTVYYPKHLLEGLDPQRFYEWEFWLHPIGNGPYRYVRTLPQTMIELEANPNYFRGRPEIERVVLKFGEPNSNELLSGNVDALPSVGPDLLKLAEDERFRLYYGATGYTLHAILWNQRELFFRDSKVRVALTYAIDRRGLHQLLNLPDALPVSDVVFTTDQFRRRELPESLPYDPERAGQLLDEAGWSDLDGDGVREKEGEAFRFATLVSPGSSWTAAVYVQDQLRRAGVRMDIQMMDYTSLRKRLYDAEFEAVFYRVTYMTHSHFFGASSLLGYRNPRVANLIDAIQASMNPAELDSIYRELMPILQADLPVTFLWPECWFTIAHRRIRGLSSPHRVDPVWYMEHLWLAEDD